MTKASAARAICGGRALLMEGLDLRPQAAVGTCEERDRVPRIRRSKDRVALARIAALGIEVKGLLARGGPGLYRFPKRNGDRG